MTATLFVLVYFSLQAAFVLVYIVGYSHFYSHVQSIKNDKQVFIQ